MGIGLVLIVMIGEVFIGGRTIGLFGMTYGVIGTVVD
jgi:hypothetical protein